MERIESTAALLQNDTKELQQRIIDKAYVAISIMAMGAVALSGIRSWVYGLTPEYVWTSFVSFSFVLLTLFRKRFGLMFKVLYLVACVIVVVIASLSAYGFVASAKLYVALVPVFVSFILPYRYALGSLIVLLFIFLFTGHLFGSGVLSYDIDLEQYASGYVAWWVEAIVMLLTSWGLLYVGYNYRRFLEESNDTVRRQYKELTEKENRYRALFESSNDAIILIKGRQFHDWNSKTCEIFQCDDDYLRSIQPYQLSPEFQPDGQRSQDKVTHYFRKLAAEGPQVFDWQHVRPNGELFFVSVGLNLITLDNETYIQSVLRDISEKKAIEAELTRYRNDLEQLVRERTNELDHTVLELQKSNRELSEKGSIIHAQNEELKEALHSLKETQSQLLQAEKMASLGVLTAGVAHEINNPLNYIQGGYSGLTKYFRDQGIEDPDIIDLLQNIRVGIDRSVSIVSGLNQFSRNNEHYDEDCHIHKILDNCLLMLSSQLKRRVEVSKEYTPEDVVIPGNVGKIHQVFINLLTNASQAVGDDGRIRVVSEKLDDAVVIRIADNGKGIPKEYLPKVTDPFFTTKEPGEGTGLGLSITYSIMQEHKGGLDFKSEVGRGTEVIVTFPIKK